MYYLLYLLFPFPTQTDEEDRAKYIFEGSDHCGNEPLSSGYQKEGGKEKGLLANATSKIV